MKWARLIRMIATLLVVVGAALFLYHHRAELAVLQKPSLLELGALVALLLIFFVVTGWIFYLLVATLGVELEPRQWLGLTFLTNALNYLGPIRPGMILKALYLKRLRLSYAHFSSVVAANFFLALFFTGAAGLLVLAAVWMQSGVGSALLAGVCAAAVLISGLPWLVPLTGTGRSGRLWELLDRALEGFRRIRDQRAKVALVGLGVTSRHLISALLCLVSFSAFGFEIDFLTALTLGIFVALSNMISITPNNVGVQEIVMAYVYATSGMDFTDGLIGAGLIRAVHLVLAFVMAPFFLDLVPGARLAGLFSKPEEE